MAITDINISEQLETGAPSIKYTGKEGPRPSMQSQEEMQMAQQVWEAMGDEERGQFSNFQEFFRSGVWKQILQQAQQDEAQGIQGLGPRNSGDMQMASADSMLIEEYQKYVFEMEEQGLQPMSLEEFRQQAMAGMAQGGRIGYRYGKNYKSNQGSNEMEFNRDAKLKYLREMGATDKEIYEIIVLGKDISDYHRNLYEEEKFNQEKQQFERDLERDRWRDPNLSREIGNFIRPMAQGGRIGYQSGGDRYEAKIKELMDRGLSRELAEALVISELSPDAYTIIPEDKAQGGRIGARFGGDMEELSMRETIDTPEGIETLKETENMEMAGPDWYIKRIEHLIYLGFDEDKAAEIAYDSDKYYEAVGHDPGD